MVIGVIPVAVTMAGNVLTPAFRWRRLALPLTLVMLGLALVSALAIFGVSTRTWSLRRPRRRRG